MTNLAFIDTETTGLGAGHEIWEVALILRVHEEEGVIEETTDFEYVWHLPVDLTRADPEALRIGRFHDRYDHDAHIWGSVVQHVPLLVDHDGEERLQFYTPSRWVLEFVKLTWDAVLVVNNPSFDVPCLEALLRRHNQCPMWHYHPLDVKSLAAGWASKSAQEWYGDDATPIAPPWSTRLLALAVGVDVDEFDLHTALGDARLNRAVYDRVMGS